jgi:hypothetical protein
MRHSVEKPVATLQFVRRICAGGRFFIPFDGAPGHVAPG